MITLISHFYNEELLIKDWIEHHIPFFDAAVLINYQSTDRSVEIARSVMPSSWKIINTGLADFEAIAVDNEVMDVESGIEGWKMALNTTEYLFCADFRDRLQRLEKEHPDVLAFGSRPISLVDTGQMPFEKPLWKNRTHGFINYGEDNPIHRQWRFIHKAPRGNYTHGRHDTYLPKYCDPEFLHLHLVFSPWPECIPRKLQIQTRIPYSNKIQGMGVQHITDQDNLTRSWLQFRDLSYDLLTLPVYQENYKRLLEMRNAS